MPGPGRAREDVSSGGGIRAVTTVPSAEVVLDLQRPAQAGQRLAAPRRSPTPLRGCTAWRRVGRGEARAQGGLLVGDARPLVADPQSVAPIEDGDDHAGERGVDEVLDQFPEHPERDAPPLFPGQSVGSRGDSCSMSVGRRRVSDAALAGRRGRSRGPGRRSPRGLRAATTRGGALRVTIHRDARSARPSRATRPRRSVAPGGVRRRAPPSGGHRFGRSGSRG